MIKFGVLEHTYHGYFIMAKDNDNDATYLRDYKIAFIFGLSEREFKDALKEFNGKERGSYNEIYFSDKNDAKDALEWLESIVMATKLSQKSLKKVTSDV